MADLLWEKNTVPAEKTSQKVRIIRQANMAYILEIQKVVNATRAR